MTARFVQIHSLTAYPGALLNRDDAGFAKRLPFGGVTRTRISSQCLKRHWRTFAGNDAIRDATGSDSDANMAVRSRRTFEQYVHQPLRNAGVPDDVAAAVTTQIMARVLGVSEKAKAGAGTERAEFETGQVTVLGRPELDYLFDQARSICVLAGADAKVAVKLVDERFEKKREMRENIDKLQLHAGLDAAVFGRMVTSDILSRCDAAVHVAHAFTVHGEAAETDYFSAVDDLLQGADTGELGAGHIGTTELTSGLYYGYVVVDVPLLVSNLTGCPPKEWLKEDRNLAGEVVRRLIMTIATVTPGAKLGSTAPYAIAHLVLAETGDVQPRTLANAFLRPVREVPDVMDNAFAALANYLGSADGMYGRSTQRRLAAISAGDALATLAHHVDHGPEPLRTLADGVAAEIVG